MYTVLKRVFYILSQISFATGRNHKLRQSVLVNNLSIPGKVF